MRNTPHYHGFIDTCASLGIEKSAADRLYKTAAASTFLGSLIGGLGRLTGSSLRNTVSLARGAKNYASLAADVTGRALGESGRFIVTQGGRAARAAGRAANQAANTFGSGYAAAGGPAINIPIPKNLFRRIGTAVTSPTTTVYNFIKKHPLISAAGGVYLGASAVSPDQDDRDSVERMRMRTMTPSEKAMYERYGSGTSLPGFGLDPMYFNGGSDARNMLNYLDY